MFPRNALAAGGTAKHYLARDSGSDIADSRSPQSPIPNRQSPIVKLCLIAATLVLTGCPFWGLPIINVQPASEVTGPGFDVSFDVSATGVGLLYQWQKDGADISGATSDIYEIAAAQDSDQGNYACLVSNSLGSVLSAQAELVVSVEYGQGFDAGFALDDWYWSGFDDSYDTVDLSPVYYQGGEIQFVETPYYDRGHYDGIWYAYNDGYFVAYDYAFAVGFSEGYDAAFYSDYLAFLAEDQHVEYDNGGWGDGYNDGFSEGRVFGANDYEQGLAFDWLDALLDYESGTDLYFAEVDVGTGAYGPVILYQYGTDPTQAKGRLASRLQSQGRMEIRKPHALAAAKSAIPLYRILTDEERAKFDVRPDITPRSGRDLTLTTTWLERILAYQQAVENPAKNSRSRTVSK
jgi:hypothetical protein